MAIVPKFGQIIDNLLRTDPTLAAEKALKKLLQPGRMIPNAQERRYLDTAETAWIEVDGVSIKTYAWSRRVDSRTVLLSHGFSMNAATMLNFVQPLVLAGFKVVTWDHCAHGESGGNRADCRIWMNTIRKMAELHAPLAGIVGFSMGGTAAVMTLAQHSALHCPVFCSLNPPLQFDTMLRKFVSFHGCNAELLTLIPRVAREKGMLLPEQLREILPTSDRLASTKTLIIQDRHDRVASVSEAQWLAGNLAHCELHFTEQLGHNGALSDRGVVRLATQFITKHEGHVKARASKL
ncbi:hypothetical protein H2200_012199 [Cladophialophora chaetospira]|uniref:Serine aminopeptidase S33 domain-containing protein n=1 Tax=Cladophialophora chaetospira TaxID=386627 RepID=A0AA38WYG9_9EURO|nr:hypothetical protein H2200_012199 [Cladophialophora chaetospira]